MKHVKRATTIISCVIIIILILIDVCVTFAVKNVNITITYIASHIDYIGSLDESISSVSERLNSLTGHNIISLNASSVGDLLNNSDYFKFVALEKVYPATLNIHIAEVSEMYAIESDGLYYTYSDDGEYITTKSSLLNNIDNTNNILVECDDTKLSDIIEIGDVFYQTFSSYRSLVKSIDIQEMDDIKIASLSLYTGANIRIVEYDKYLQDKLTNVNETYLSLNDLDKAYSTLSVYASTDGDVYVLKSN